MFCSVKVMGYANLKKMCKTKKQIYSKYIQTKAGVRNTGNQEESVQFFWGEMVKNISIVSNYAILNKKSNLPKTN